MPVFDTIERIVFEGVDKLTAPSKAAQKSVGDLREAVGSVQKVFAALGVTVGAGLFVKLALDTVNAQDELGKMSQRVGVSVESLSALQYAGKLADVSLESLGVGLKQLSRNMLDAQAGTGEAQEAFKALGIETTKAGGGLKMTEKLFGELADKFAGIEDGAGKTALAMKIFGKSGADLIPLLNGGRAGLEAMTEEARRLGLVVSTDAAQAAERFNDNLTRLSASFEGVKRAIVNEALPALADWTEQMSFALRLGSPVENAKLFFTDNAAWRERFAQLETFKRAQLLRSEIAAAGPFPEDVFPGTTQKKAAPALANPDAGKPLSAMEILKKQAEGQDVFDDYVRKSNAEMSKYLDEEQKKRLDSEKDWSLKRIELYEESQFRAEQMETAKFERARELADQEIERIRDLSITEEERELARYQRSLDMLNQTAMDQFEHDQIVEQVHAEHVNRMVAIEQNKNQRMRALQVSALNNAVGLLQLFAGKSKEVAFAIIAIEKGLRIAETISSGAAAEIRALAELGPIAGPPAAAAIRGWTMVNVGLIAAQGIVEAAHVSGGGAGATPVFSANPNTGAPVGAAVHFGQPPPRDAVTIIVHAEDRDTLSVAQVRQLVEDISDAAEHGARVFIEKG